MTIEREQFSGNLQSGQWRSVVKETWQPIDRDLGLTLPLAWAGIQGAGYGLGVLTLGAAAAALAGDLRLLAVGTLLGIGTAAIVTAGKFVGERDYAKETLTAREIYDSTGLAMANTDSQRATVQLPKIEVVTVNNPDTIAEYQDPDSTDYELRPGDAVQSYGLPVPTGTALAVYRAVDSGAAKWSKSSISGIPGISQAEGRELFELLLEAGFLRYPGGNKYDPNGADLTPAGRAFWRAVGQCETS